MLNANSAPSQLPESEEDSWLDQVLQLLADMHSPGMMGALSFDVIQSRYSVSMVGSCAPSSLSRSPQDLAIDLRGDSFIWRWETFSIGYKQSADVLSKHLMIPLLSTAYLAAISPDAISEISGSDLEKVGFNKSHTIMSTLVSVWRGANYRLMPYHGARR